MAEGLPLEAARVINSGARWTCLVTRAGFSGKGPLHLLKPGINKLQQTLESHAPAGGGALAPGAARPWVTDTLRQFNLFRLPAASEFMDLAWDAIEPSTLLADLHREYFAHAQRLGRAVLTEERWRRPHHCPARYVFNNGRSVLVMQLEIGKSELRLVFRSGVAATKSIWRQKNGPSEPIGRVDQERRLVLSLSSLNNVPVRDSFTFLLEGLPAAGWLHLCGAGTSPPL